MQVCWFIMECFEQCSQWNAKRGLGLEPWGFKNFPALWTWNFECLFGFVFCTCAALCIVPLYTYVTHCWSWNFVWYNGGLELGTLGELWVQAHCYCIWVESLLRLRFKSLAMFKPCSVHVVYVCVTSYWVVCSMLSFKTFFLGEIVKFECF